MELTKEDIEREKRIHKLKREQEILIAINREQDILIQELERDRRIQEFQITARIRTLAEMKKRRPKDD